MSLKKDFSLNKRLKSDTFFIDDLPLCKFLLMNDSNYPWFLLVPRINDIKELYEFNQKDRVQLDFEIVEVSKFIKSSFKPKKINIASFHLGRRDVGGEAIALIEVDGGIDEKIVSEIKSLPQVARVNSIYFE